MQATSINASDLGVVNSLYAFILQVKIWPGRTKLTKEDFPDVELPPEEIASLGSKKLCDPEKLRPFGKLKARAEELLDNRGVRFLKGWAIPESIAEDTAEQLDAIMEEFDVEKEMFLTNYNGIIRDWINQHPLWSNVIANSSVSESHVRARLGFKWQAFEVAMPQPGHGESSALNRGLQEEVSGLGNTLYAEIAKAADEAWKRCYQGKSKVSHKALSPLRTILSKLVTLSFVEPHVAPVADLIRTAMDNVPKKGWISGAPLITLQGMVSMLRDPDALIEHARLVMADTDPMAVLESIAGGVPMNSADYFTVNEPGDASTASETEAKEVEAPPRATGTDVSWRAQPGIVLGGAMSMYNRKTLMGCLPLVASMIGRTHGVRITIGGDTAYATPDKQINLPELPLDMSDHDLKMTRGYLDHECGHQRDTNFDCFARARNPFLRDLLNYVEDIRIERKMSGIYPGCRDNFDYLNHALYDEPFKLPTKAMQAALIPAWICNALYGLDYPQINQRAAEVALDLETAYPGLLSRLEPLIQEAGACQSTQDAYDVAEKMLNVIKGYMGTLPRAKTPSSSIVLDGKGQASASGQASGQQGGAASPGGSGGSGGPHTCDATQSLQDMLNGNHRVAVPRSTGERMSQLLGALSRNSSPYSGTFEVAQPDQTNAGQLHPLDLSGAKAATRVLTTRLRGLLQTMTLSRFSSGRRGKVDGGRLHRIATNNPKVFSRETPSISTDTLVHILMDRSGSMDGCISLACSACYAVAGALYPIKGVATAVTVFPADLGYATLTELIKPGQAIHTRLATGVAGGTPMGQAVWWVLQQMIHQPQNRKILLLITDGVPDSLENATKAFGMAKILNIEVHGIGIGDGAERIADLIPGSKIIHDIKELANAMFAILQKALTAR